MEDAAGEAPVMLAIDTSTSLGSVAVGRQGEVLAEIVGMGSPGSKRSVEAPPSSAGGSGLSRPPGWK